MQYFLALHAGDYRKLRLYAESEGIFDFKMSYPTVFAVRNGAIRGVITTATDQGCLQLCALVSEGEKLWTWLRLVEMYERLLQAAGVTCYFFPVPSGKPEWRAMVERAAEVVLIEDGDPAWYRRNLNAP